MQIAAVRVAWQTDRLGEVVAFYCDADSVDATASRALAEGRAPVAAENPYWSGVGAVVLPDPDGRRLVLVPTPPRVLASGVSGGT